jgi:hypothetical protein
MKKLEIEASVGSPAIEPTRENKRGPIPPKFKEGDDVEIYLGTFERLAKANNWLKDTWAPRLAALLTGRARDAYSRMHIDSIGDYDAVRRAILERYELNGEYYRDKLRSTYKKYDETYREWSIKLNSFLERWLEFYKVDTFDGLKERVVMEQMLNNTPHELNVWLRDREPDSVENLTKLADLYNQTRTKKRYGRDAGRNDRHKFENRNDPQKSENKNESHKSESGVNHGDRKISENSNDNYFEGKKAPYNLTCRDCGGKGHYAINCTEKKKGLLCLSPSRPGYVGCDQFEVAGHLNGQSVTC